MDMRFRDPNGHRRAFTLIELMIVIAIVGILAAIAIPNFMKLQGRSRQAEVRENLKACFTAEKAYYQVYDTFSNLITPIGFSPERGNRYCYDLGGGIYQSRSTTVAGVDSNPPTYTGVEADTFQFGPTSGTYGVMTYAFTPAFVVGAYGSFEMVAAGNIDNDILYDEWSISSSTKSAATDSSVTGCAMGNNPGGEPCVDFDDTTHSS